jgi:hypothetical protein
LAKPLWLKLEQSFRAMSLYQQTNIIVASQFAFLAHITIPENA